MKILLKTFGFLVFAAVVLPVFAHHSFAGYEMSKTFTATGTIKEFRWGAPHCYAVFAIKNANGTVQEVTVLTGSPAMFFNQGFTKTDLKVGEKVEIAWHPSRNGNAGGALAGITLANGRTFKDAEISSIAVKDAPSEDAGRH